MDVATRNILEIRFPIFYLAVFDSAGFPALHYFLFFNGENMVSMLRVLAISLLCCTSGISLAGEPRTSDVDAFDISGVRLGMSLNEARDGMAKFYGVKSGAIRQIDVTRSPKRVQLIHGQRGMSLTVSLTADSANPASDNFRVVSVSLFGQMTDQDQQDLFERLKTRFGAPTVKTGGPAKYDFNAFWCSKIKPQFGEPACNHSVAYMRLFGGLISLENKAIDVEQTERLNKSSTAPLKF